MKLITTGLLISVNETAETALLSFGSAVAITTTHSINSQAQMLKDLCGEVKRSGVGSAGRAG